MGIITFFNLDNDPKRIYINNEYIYAYYLRGKRTSPSGHYIVKRNLETGEKKWAVREDHTMTGWRTNITRALFLDENSNLIHIGLVPISTYPKKSIWVSIRSTNTVIKNNRY